MLKKNTSPLVAGIALFSMFFGAGDLIWPLILGGVTGDHSFFALIGLLVTGVSLPLLGLIAMLLFNGDTNSFFERIGKAPSLFLLFLIQAILGPLGSLPRIITLSHATLSSYLPIVMPLGIFSILFGIVIFFFTVRKQRIIEILGMWLTPMLLLCLVALFGLGFINTPARLPVMEAKEALQNGLSVGYNTLDLLASFLFAPLVLSHFQKEHCDLKQTFRKMVKSSLIAATLLGLMYVGLTFLGASYTPHLPHHLPEERLREISSLLLGTQGAFIASIAVVLACLTTAIPLTAIFAEYTQKTLLKGKISFNNSLIVTLLLSSIVSNLGFMGIAKFLSPFLQILCPGLIVLSVLNILHRLYEIQIAKGPVYTAFALSTIGYAIFL